MKKLAPLVALLALLTVMVAPATARGAWVDRIEDVDTILAVRFDDDFPLASVMRATCDYAQFVMQPTGAGDAQAADLVVPAQHAHSGEPLHNERRQLVYPRADSQADPR